MRIERLEHGDGSISPVLWAVSRTGTHVALSIDPAQIDDAAVEKMAKALMLQSPPLGYDDPVEWHRIHEKWKVSYRNKARAALAALLAHLAEVE